MSLPPLAEYLARLDEAYGPSAPASVACGDCGRSIEFWPPDDGTLLPVTCLACGWTATLAMDAAPVPPGAETGH